MLKALLLAWALLSSASAEAAFCLNGHPSVEAEYKAARHVALVRGLYVREEVRRTASFRGRRYTERGRVQVFVPVKTFKGRLPRTIRQFDAYDSGRFPVDVGVTYLVFVHQHGNGRLWIDACGNSDEARSAGAALARVRALALRRRRGRASRALLQKGSFSGPFAV
jgi:hypothetical protein